MEQVMLALMIEYSKPMMLFLLIGAVVTLSRFGERPDFTSAHPHESQDPAL